MLNILLLPYQCDINVTMVGKEKDKPIPQDVLSQDKSSIDPQPELVQQIDSYGVWRKQIPELHAMEYDVHSAIDPEQYLHMESYGSKDGQQSYYSGLWDSTAPVDDFLSYVGNFFERYAVINPEYAGQVEVFISGDKVRSYKGELPITRNELLELEGANIGSKTERLKFMRIENNLGAFTWEPTKSGFIVVPSIFPDQSELQQSLAGIYEASKPPAIPKTVFEKTLVMVATDSFQNPAQK